MKDIEERNAAAQARSILSACMLHASGAGLMALINVIDHIQGIYHADYFPLTFASHNAARDAWHAEIGVSGYPCDICGDDTTQEEISIASISNAQYMMHLCPPCGRKYYAKFYPAGSEVCVAEVPNTRCMCEDCKKTRMEPAEDML